MPVMAPALKAMSSPPASDLVAACAVHADEAGRARQNRADGEADRDQPAEREADDEKDHHADDADGGVLPLEIGLRALAHGRRDLLHPRRTLIGTQHRQRRPDAVQDREYAAADDQPQCSHGAISSFFYSELGGRRTLPPLPWERRGWPP